MLLAYLGIAVIPAFSPTRHTVMVAAEFFAGQVARGCHLRVFLHFFLASLRKEMFVSNPMMNSTALWTDLTQSRSGDQQPTTVNVSMSADETQTITIQSTSFTTSTITETVRGPPGIAITTKTSRFPNISNAGFPEPWMSATGADLSRWLSGHSFPGETDQIHDPYSPSAMKHTESAIEITSDIFSDYSELTSRFSSVFLPMTVSASITSTDSTSSTLPLPGPTSAFSSTEFPAPTSSLEQTPPVVETPVAPLGDGPPIPTPIAESDSLVSSSIPSGRTSSSPVFLQPSEPSPIISPSSTREVPVILPFTQTHYTFSTDCPLTEDCATWKPETPQPTQNVVIPFDSQEGDSGGPPQAEDPFPVQKRNISMGSSLDSRGYGLLVAFFIAGIVCGIGLFLVGRRLWSVWRRRRHRKRKISSGHDTELVILPRRRRGSASPTHVSGMQSSSRDNLADTRLLRRSWQEDSVV